MRLYFDHNATTPVDPAVAEIMGATLREDFGNASSVHHFGQMAKARLDEARTSVASLIGADPSEVVFTSGGTEADNFALRGVAEALEPTGRKHLIASAIEHEAVLNTLKALTRRGWTTTLLPVDTTGIVSPDALASALTDDDGGRVGDAREQRNRHRAAGCGARSPVARARCALSHGCRAVGCEDPGGRPNDGRRPAVALCTQIQRPKGGGRPVDQARHARHRDPHWRQARTESSRRNRKRPRAGRAWAWPPSSQSES